MPNMMIPMPPNHWVSDLQNNNPRGWVLMQSGVLGKQLGLIEVEMTVAPVVEKPDIDSNQELTAPRAMSKNSEPSVKGP